MLAKSPGTAPSLSDAVWIDLLNATEAERAEVEQATKLRLPTRAALEEIETSSRVYVEDGAFYLSTPVLEGRDCLNAVVTTVGFVLTPERLITIRFAPVEAFEGLLATYASVAEPQVSDAFLRILEAVVDYTADALEHASTELERISHAAFHIERPRGREHVKMSEALHAALRKLGRMGDGISHIRDTLLGIGRITAFVHQTAQEAHAPAASARFNAIRADIASLNDHHAHLSGKVQFLLDATLGFISIQQNDIVKTLTIVSVVGVPPVLIAGVYGMNFHHMPELSWTFGYPLALILIVGSGFLPILWFKWRGWM